MPPPTATPPVFPGPSRERNVVAFQGGIETLDDGSFVIRITGNAGTTPLKRSGGSEDWKSACQKLADMLKKTAEVVATADITPPAGPG